MTQNDRKLCLSSYITQEAYIVCSWFWVHICKMMTSPDAFFIFSKFWFARLLGGERAKIGPKWQKIVSHSVCQEWYPMWFWFLMHMCKMISPAIFFIFSKFWFFGFLGEGDVKKQKMTHNDQFQSVALYISGTVDHIIKIFGTQVWNNDISRCFSLFFFKKYNTVNIKIVTFFIGPPQEFLNQ